MVLCQVIGCQNRSEKSGSGRSFFKFPDPKKRPDICLRWIEALKLDRTKFSLDSPEIRRNRVVCSDHFTCDDISTDLQSKLMPGTRILKRLREDAVPSVFINLPTVPHRKTDSKSKSARKKKGRRNAKAKTRQVGAGQPSTDVPGRVTITRPPREPQQPDWSVVDVSLDEDYGGWEMEEEEDSSIQMQGDRSMTMQGGGEQWVEQLPQSHQGMVAATQPYPHDQVVQVLPRDRVHDQVVQVLPRDRVHDQVVQVLPSVSHVPLHRQSASSHSLAQDISPHNAKRRRTEQTYHAAQSADDYRQHQQIQNQSAEEDPVVMVVTSGRKQPQMQPQLTTTARAGGKSQGIAKRVDTGEVLMVRDTSPVMIEEWGTGSGVKRQTVRSNGVRGKGSRDVTRGGSPSNSYQRPGRVSPPLLSNADPMAPVSFEEDEDAYGYCFTCQDPLIYEDQEKRSLLATQDNMKVLHALRQMCWPGLFSPDPRFFSTLTCCGSCVELIKEYVQTLKTLSTLKGTWLERTGHNSAPHFNPLHQDISFARDSAGFNTSSMQRPSWHSPAASPRRDNLQPASNEHYQQVDDSPVREPRQAGRSDRVSQRQVRDISGPSRPTLMRGHRNLSQRHRDIDQDEDPVEVGTSDDLEDNSRTQQEDFPELDSAVGSQNRGQSSTRPETKAQRDRGGARASPLPQTLTGKSRRKGTPTRQTPPPSVASPSKTSQAETTANQQTKVTGKGDAGKRSLSERVHKEPDGSPGDLDPGDPEAEVVEGSGDSLPPSVPSTSQGQPDEQRQDAEPKADHNFESRQEDADVPITIKEEPVESYGDQPGGSGLPMETPGDTWGLDEGR